MTYRLRISLLLAWAIAQACLSPASAAWQGLPAFGAVQLCVPYNVQVRPGTTYALSVEGDQSVASAITTGVTGNVLAVGSNGFTSSQPIQVVITLPRDKLVGVYQNGLQAAAYVAPGFNGGALSVVSGFGAGEIFVSGASYNSVNVENSGTGVVSLSGSFDAVNLQATGITNTYIGGVGSSVNVGLSGISNVYLAPTSSSVKITGRASGISSVQYSQGACSVQSDFPLRSTCVQSSGLSIQVPSEPQWTSGLTARGTFNCVGSSGSTSSSTASSPVPTPVPTPQASPSQTSASAAATAPQIAKWRLLGAGARARGRGRILQLCHPTPGGFQSQSGSTGPQGNNANAVAQGTNSASASSTAGPGGVSTQTSNDGTSNQLSTAGPVLNLTPHLH
ncbi:hypothetical protein APUTEX25_005093 [Auxenochlorella protothecoides]|uniref:Putative auto-transporter adhesin head GIN domain-containing protein n=1 Tax=Auxenochlorella protothecoides TaxID=3075 RepID=A0A3M7KRA7_AUXPR|nr:hypothetical protein APUTEX25_005093 [Auxenochlorella protothecoides]|eukprot:RMZ52340.1 hypothetical protein APUTEX25_005093 [Auxenochlorella protothecoides]